MYVMRIISSRKLFVLEKDGWKGICSTINEYSIYTNYWWLAESAEHYTIIQIHKHWLDTYITGWKMICSNYTGLLYRRKRRKELSSRLACYLLSLLMVWIRNVCRTFFHSDLCIIAMHWKWWYGAFYFI